VAARVADRRARRPKAVIEQARNIGVANEPLTGQRACAPQQDLNRARVACLAAGHLRPDPLSARGQPASLTSTTEQLALGRKQFVNI